MSNGRVKTRVVYNPSPYMRVIQHRILTRILNLIQIPEYLTAFEAGRSVVQTAALHTNKEVVISWDIQDYFPSIKVNCIIGIFENLGYNNQASRVLAELCTYKHFLPQGGLCSPKIANLVAARTFGPILKSQVCTNDNVTMTIYADDITVSAKSIQDLPSTPEQISEWVAQTLNRFRFNVNTRKTKVMRSNQRQYVCGVVVNEKTNLYSKEKLKLRAIVHNCEVNGIPAEAAKNEVEPGNFIASIRGKLNWFRQLNPEVATRYYDRFQAVATAYETTVQPTPVGAVLSQETENGVNV